METFEGNNIGGLSKLEICFHTDLASYNPAVFKAGKAWLDIPFDDESAVLDFNAEETDQGNLYNYTGRVELRKQRPDVKAALYPYIGRNSIIKATDMNGEVSILGAPGLAVKLSAQAKTGAKYIDKNSLTIAFEVQMPFVALAQ